MFVQPVFPLAHAAVMWRLAVYAGLLIGRPPAGTHLVATAEPSRKHARPSGKVRSDSPHRVHQAATEDDSRASELLCNEVVFDETFVMAGRKPHNELIS